MTIEFRVDGFTESRDDHFAAHIRGLGITGYGDTIEGARERVMTMAGMMLGHIENTEGIDAALARLNRAGVSWREVSPGAWESGAILRTPAEDDAVPV